KKNCWIEKPKVQQTPLGDGLVVYTDAGKRQRQAGCVWNHNGQWQKKLIQGQAGDTLQTLELTAVVWALINSLDTPINIITDSLYVAGIVPRIQDALLRDTANPRLGQLFL
ncbi:POK19 protein, partial [Sagittarius serpentarius]|nr:POK19 protein [Sagittarius serpentarius]